jgi:hypothetical protein
MLSHLNPCKADTQKSRIVSLVASIALLIFTVGIVHAICAMRRICQKSKDQLNSTDKKTQEIAKEQLKIETKKEEVETQEETNEEVKAEVQFSVPEKEPKPQKNGKAAKRRSTGWPADFKILDSQNDVKGMPKSFKDSGRPSNNSGKPADFVHMAMQMTAPPAVKGKATEQDAIPSKVMPPKPKKPQS